MDNMVLANLAARPIRSLTSIVGIALGVILILVTVGLARGMLLSSGEREGNLQAELVFLPPSGFGAGIHIHLPYIEIFRIDYAFDMNLRGQIIIEVGIAF